MAYNRIDRPTILGDRAGHTAMVSAFGDLVTGRRLAYISESFHHNVINTVTIATPSTSGAGASVTAASELLTVNAGTSGTGTASVRSRHAVRYRPGHGCEYYFTAMFTTGAAAADADQWQGPLTATDGFAVGVRNGAFCLLHRRGGSDTYIAIADMDVPLTTAGNASGMTLDPSKINLFRVTYGYLGVAPPTFWVCTSDGSWFPFHRISTINSRTTTHVKNPNLPMAIEVTKRSGASNVIAYAGSWFGGMIGVGEDEHVGSRHGAYQSGVVSLSSGVTKLLALVKCASTYGGATNTAELFMRQLNAATDGTRAVQFRWLLNPSITGTPSYTDYDATNSIVSYDVTLSGVSITGGRLVGAMNVEKSGGGSQDYPPLEVHFVPGDVIALTALSAANNDISYQFEWDELF